MYVLTIDQIGSRRGVDEVPALLAHLAARATTSTFLRGPERTVGDEIQALLIDAHDVVDLALDLVRLGGWSIGIGVGSVVQPVPSSTREAAGEAFIRARDAVERAKAKGPSVPLAIEGRRPAAASHDPAAEAEAVLRLVGVTLARRTPQAWEVIDRLARAGATQKDAAEELNISVQAVSKRLRTALWADEQAVRPLAVRLLQEADS